MRKPTVEDCRIIDLGKIEFDRGNLTVVQARETVPFDIKRVFYLYDIPGGEARGAHAHKECHQFLVAASGSFAGHLGGRAGILLRRRVLGAGFRTL